MESEEKDAGKRKALEAFGCLLYIIAFLIMGAVLVSRCSAIFK